jgi:hypothetical protein
MLVYPVFVHPGIHVVLHGQHVEQRLFQAFTSLNYDLRSDERA